MLVKFASLCTGAGGFDLGLESAGMECVFQCEINKKCWPTLEKWWPDVRRTEDVNSCDTERIIREENPQLIAFGFPCQDLSVAGNRKGLAGERSGLFFRCADLLQEQNPEWVLIENVPGLLSSNGGRDMGTVLGTLGEIGYRWAYRVLDAQYFGVPQRRRRVFIVGHFGEGADPSEVLFESESMCWDSPTSREKRKDIAKCLTASPNGFRYDSDTENLIPELVQVSSYRTSGNCGAWDQGDKTAALNCATDPDQNVLVEHGIGYKYRVRRLMPVECERLMGWPDNHTQGADTRRYQMCGNGVVAPVAKWIGERIMRVSS